MLVRSRSLRTAILMGSATLALPLLLADCRDPTQISLRIRTNAECLDVIDTTITVGKLGEIEKKPQVATTANCEDASNGRIGSLVVVPSGDKDDEVAVKVVTGINRAASQCTPDNGYSGCIVARRALRFRPHESVEMPILMALDCLDVPCNATQTCKNGNCVPADDPECEKEGCEAGAPDAGIDAPLDQSSGGAAGSAGSGGSSGSGASSGSGGSSGQDASDVTFVPCTAPAAECDGDPATVCEVDLDTSASHCGSCDHDCLGGLCAGGKCQPVTVWSGPTPTRLALDETFVYFVNYNNGGVFRVPKQGGAADTLATGQKSVRIGVDATHVYWTNEIGSQILRVPKQLGAQSVVTSQANTPYGFALSGSTVYFAELRSGGSVASVPKTGGAPTPIATGENWPFEVSVTASHVYWTELANNAGLRRAPLSGGPAETLLSSLANPTAVVNDGTNVYMAVLGNGVAKGQILSIPTAGGASVLLAEAQAQPRGLAVDALHIYWTNAANGTVMRIAKDGSDNKAATVMASGGQEPIGIAIDETAVYWADDKANLLRKVAK
jgi:uncharacterized membrane protein YgcG